MADCSDNFHRRTGGHYGAFAFGSVVVTAFATFLSHQRYFTGPEWVVPTFAAGAVYATLGVLWSGLAEHTGWRRHTYYFIQLSLLTLIVFASPARGFTGIVVLPLVSQAVFDLRRTWASAIVVYLFGITVFTWGFPFGWEGVMQAALSYATAFIFTVAFTLITRQALMLREREEKLRGEVEAANRQLREYAAQAEELATTRERNRLAREIHDGVGHYLTVVKTQLDAAAALLPADPARAKDVVVKAAKLSADALDDVRRSVGAFRTDQPRPPLPDALRALVSEAALPVQVSIEGETRPLAPGVEHALFRAAQEALTNVRKHAHASAATLRLEFNSSGSLALEVADNGRGCEHAMAPAGFGLQGMRERIELLGGKVSSANRVEGGFAVKVEVPG